jgi:ParB family transcriptional regulator, chromosome partitioning protein
MARRGLGRGLSALIPTGEAETKQKETPEEELQSGVKEDETTATAEKRKDAAIVEGTTQATEAKAEGAEAEQPASLNLKDVAIDKIVPNPHQPRKQMDDQALEDLVSSIKELGIVQPIVVRPSGDAFELVVGERRWRASQKAGLKTIPAIIRTSTNTESLEMALVENIQRENLNAIEEALAYRQLIDDFDISQNDIAKRVGKDRATVANTLRLLQLPPEIQRLVVGGDITSGHARSLLALQGDSFQGKLARRIVREDLSVRQIEDIIRRWRKGIASEPARRKPLQPKGLVALAEKLSEFLQAPVKVHMGRKKGKIDIEFSTIDDLERIYEAITKKN